MPAAWRSGEFQPSAAATSRAWKRVPSPSVATVRQSRSARHEVDASRRQQAQARQVAGALEQRTAQHTILDDIAERRRRGGGTVEVAVVVMQEQRRFVVGDANFADRLGLAGNVGPQADAVEHQLRSIGDGRGAPVEFIVEHRCRVLPVDHRDLEPGIGAGDAEQHAVEPAPGDQQLDIIRSCAETWADVRL